jgi:hypothetical protein
MSQTLTPDLVARAGMALYGDEWQMPLARLLNVNQRTMRRVAQAAREATPYQVNQGWASEIKAALQPVPLERKLQARYAAEVLEALSEIE